MLYEHARRGILGIVLCTVAVVAGCHGDATGPKTRPVAPPYAPRHYRVVDLTTAFGDSGTIRTVSNRDHVLGANGGSAVLWHDGVLTTLSGCATPLNLNDNDQVLCALASGVGVWTNGTIRRIAGFDTIPGRLDVVAFINDAGDVGGMWVWAYPFTWIGGQFWTGKKFYPNLAPLAFDNNGSLIFRYVAYEGGGGVPPGYETDEVDANADSVRPLMNYRTVPAAFLLSAAKFRAFGYASANSFNYEDQLVGSLYIGATSAASAYGLPGTPIYCDSLGGIRLLKNAAVDSNWVITGATQITDSGTIRGTATNASLGATDHVVLLIPAK